jgi:hypothetical protein
MLMTLPEVTTGEDRLYREHRVLAIMDKLVPILTGHYSMSFSYTGGHNYEHHKIYPI